MSDDYHCQECGLGWVPWTGPAYVIVYLVQHEVFHEDSRVIGLFLSEDKAVECARDRVAQERCEDYTWREDEPGRRWIVAGDYGDCEQIVILKHRVTP